MAKKSNRKKNCFFTSLVKARLYGTRTRTTQKTRRFSARFAVLIGSGFPHLFCIKTRLFADVNHCNAQIINYKNGLPVTEIPLYSRNYVLSGISILINFKNISSDDDVNNTTVITRGGVEDTRFEAKDTKKSEATDSLSQDRPSRGQGQKCSRPRTKDTGASVLQKKRSSKKFFRQTPIYRRSQNF